ncbi:sulfotransferase domain-containing protein [Micromonospora sp. NPDC000207]|uniref:sulfotransferase domain-containing protein n=1 Tax=Micromonospora sp. NPDC000207 TaxID=3154246 RepID=UPI0033273A5A
MADPDEPSALAYTVRRVVRHTRWARTEGIRRLVEEDRLNPVERVGTALAKRRWRRANPTPAGRAVPVWLVGLQRSGTNMLTRGLDAAGAVEVRNENDRRVFHRFQLRPDPVVTEVIRRSRHRYVLVKPLCQTHRVDELLALPGLAPGRAVWAYRDVDDRARSEVAKFGEANLRALQAVAKGTIGDRWQGQRLDDPTRELVASFDYGRMSPHTAAALFWYVRNSLLFTLGLADRSDVLLSSYDALVADPAGTTRRLCDFLDLPYDAGLHAHVEARAPRRNPLPIDDRVRALCTGLTERLDAVAGRPLEGQRG